jgi:uncharacterized protein with PQ loop repeat
VFGISPNLLGTVATFYGVGAAASALLQARQILMRKNSCGVSARFFATYAGGYAIWLLYGLSVRGVHSRHHAGGARFAGPSYDLEHVPRVSRGAGAPLRRAEPASVRPAASTPA